MKQYEVEYRRASDFSDLIGIDITKIELCDGYGIVSQYHGYKHPDGTVNVYQGYISVCGLCDSIICSEYRAKQIYNEEKNLREQWHSLQ